MVNLALAHPESAQCIDFHHPVPSLSTLTTVVPAKRVSPMCCDSLWKTYDVCVWDGKIFEVTKWSEEERRAADVFLWSVLCQKDAVLPNFADFA